MLILIRILLLGIKKKKKHKMLKVNGRFAIVLYLLVGVSYLCIASDVVDCFLPVPCIKEVKNSYHELWESQQHFISIFCAGYISFILRILEIYLL